MSVPSAFSLAMMSSSESGLSFDSTFTISWIFSMMARFDSSSPSLVLNPPVKKYFMG